MPRPPLLIVGLDGASLEVVRPWLADGTLPTLARLMAAGTWGPLTSTIPAATFPAWTSMVTGVNPGRHGVLDFAERVPGTFRMRFVNGSHRRVPAMWTHMAAEGRRTVVVTVPATYPPESLPGGVMVSGFDTPLTAAVDGSFVAPRAKWDAIRRRVGRVPFADFQEVQPGRRWHARALASLLDGIERRTRLVEHLIATERPDVCMVVYGESDTVAHHFWRFHDPASPRWAPSRWADGIARVYAALDAAVGRLCDAFGGAPNVLVASDHGSGGAGVHAVHLNRFLASRGLLRFRASGGGRLGRLGRALALRAVPFRWQAALLRRYGALAGQLEGSVRFGGIDWERTTAFSEELDYHPSVWLNLASREPLGTVPAEAYEGTRAQVAAALAAWRDDQGRAVVERVWRREELYDGPAAALAPDLLLELAEVDGYSRPSLRSAGPGQALRILDPDEFGAGKGAGMNGSHRRAGLYLLAGPDVHARGLASTRPIVDVAPTALALADVAVPGGLDGRVMAEALRREIRLSERAMGERTDRPVDFDPWEEREVAERLVALGYLDPPS